MKIVMYTIEPRIRASQRHSGQGLFELFVPDPPRGRPFGGGGNHRKGRRVKKMSYHTRIVQVSGEILLEGMTLEQKGNLPCPDFIRQGCIT